jgi:hypothetical protein
MLPACLCVWMCIPPLSIFECLTLSLWNSVCMSWHMSPSQWHTSQIPPICVSVCVSPTTVARQWLSKHIPALSNTHNNRKIVECIIFYTVCVISIQTLWVSLCMPLLLLGKSSGNMFPQQWRTVGGIIFSVVHVISKESKQLVLPRTSCFNLSMSNDGC